MAESLAVLLIIQWVTIELSAGDVVVHNTGGRLFEQRPILEAPFAPNIPGSDIIRTPTAGGDRPTISTQRDKTSTGNSSNRGTGENENCEKVDSESHRFSSIRIRLERSLNGISSATEVLETQNSTHSMVYASDRLDDASLRLKLWGNDIGIEHWDFDLSGKSSLARLITDIFDSVDYYLDDVRRQITEEQSDERSADAQDLEYSLDTNLDRLLASTKRLRHLVESVKAQQAIEYDKGPYRSLRKRYPTNSCGTYEKHPEWASVKGRYDSRPQPKPSTRRQLCSGDKPKAKHPETAMAAIDDMLGEITSTLFGNADELFKLIPRTAELNELIAQLITSNPYQVTERVVQDLFFSDV